MSLPLCWCEGRLRSAKILAGNCQKIEGPQVARTTCGPDNKEVSYESSARDRGSRVTLTVVLDLEDGTAVVRRYDPNPAAY